MRHTMTPELKKLLEEELARLTKEMFNRQDEINFYEECIASRNIDLMNIGNRLAEISKLLAGKKRKLQ